MTRRSVVCPRALIRNGDLQGIQIGGRGQGRVDDAKLEEYIERMYEEQRGRHE